MDPHTLREAAQAWLAVAPPSDEPEVVAALLAGDDLVGLRELFAGVLEFGTGGMRGPMGPGTLRMNASIVRRVTASLADVLLVDHPDARERGVALAWDARRRSLELAEEAARVLAARGFRVWLAPEAVPTPWLAHATVALGAVAGAIVTASHNPATDNGFKVFGHRGAQIVPPVDTAVAEGMARWAGAVPVADDATLAAHVVRWPKAVRQAYADGVEAQRVHREERARVVHTAVHGVGGRPTGAALTTAGHIVLPVPEQAEPDAGFPTVPFPNPEEPGVLALAITLADQIRADAVLANDPDADRLAVAVPDRRGTGWRQLTGNQVGVLLAHDLLAHGPRTDRDLVATTIVSTAMLARVAAAHGAALVETLTGFKWIAEAALRHEADGGRFVFGFEESIGYAAGSLVRDKDGVAAAVLVADLVAEEALHDRSLSDLLQDLYVQHGQHVSRQLSLKRAGLDGLAELRAGMARLRAAPPLRLAGFEVVAVSDVAAGTRRAGGVTTPLSVPASDVLGFELAGGGRAWIRPSGTEPKVKVYVEVVVPLDPAVRWEDAEADVAAQADAVARALADAAGL